MKKIKATKKEKLIAILISISISILAITSWIFNMGWIHLFLTFALFPVFSIVIIFLTNIFTVKYFKLSLKIKLYNIICNISFSLFYLLFPDGGDIGEMYVFFGLIENNSIATICGYFAEMFIVLHIVMLILQIVEISKIKKAS